MAPTKEEIYEQVDKAIASQEEYGEGGRWPGMSYEAGVDAALRWAVGDSEEAPMDDG